MVISILSTILFVCFVLTSFITVWRNFETLDYLQYLTLVK